MSKRLPRLHARSVSTSGVDQKKLSLIQEDKEINECPMPKISRRKSEMVFSDYTLSLIQMSSNTSTISTISEYVEDDFELDDNMKEKFEELREILCEELINENHDLQLQLEDEKDKYIDLERKLQDSQEENKNLNLLVADYKKNVSELQDEVDELQNNQIHSEINQQKHQIERNHLKDTIERLRKELTHANHELENSQHELQISRHEFEEYRRIRSYSNSNSTSSNIQPTSQPNQEKEQKGKEKEKIEQLKNEIEKVKVLLDESIVREDKERSISNALTEQLEQSQIALREIKKKIKQLHKNETRLTNDFNILKRKKTDADDCIAQQNDKIADLKNDLREQQNINETLREELEEAEIGIVDVNTIRCDDEKFVNMMDELQSLQSLHYEDRSSNYKDRSNNYKVRGAAIDADQEFFFLTSLSAKINLSKRWSCPQVADVDTQKLWNKAQNESIPLHKYHEWICGYLVKIYHQNKGVKVQPSKKWKSKDLTNSR